MKCPKMIVKIAESQPQGMKDLAEMEKRIAKKELGTIGVSSGAGVALVPLILDGMKKRYLSQTMPFGLIGGVTTGAIINYLLKKKRFNTAADQLGYDVHRQRIPFGGGTEVELFKRDIKRS